LEDADDRQAGRSRLCGSTHQYASTVREVLCSKFDIAQQHPGSARCFAVKSRRHEISNYFYIVPATLDDKVDTWQIKVLVDIVRMHLECKVIKNVIKIYNYYENLESRLILSLPRWGVEDETSQTTRSDSSDGDSSDPTE
jgi:hypothetical protein